jgi:hypothetical protein
MTLRILASIAARMDYFLDNSPGVEMEILVLGHLARVAVDLVRRSRS